MESIPFLINHVINSLFYRLYPH